MTGIKWKASLVWMITLHASKRNLSCFYKVLSNIDINMFKEGLSILLITLSVFKRVAFDW